MEGSPGDPLPGLTDSELQRFWAGHAEFNRAFSPEEGLGPLFNQTECSSCHDLPTSGGHGAEPVRKMSRYDEIDGCSLLPELGGDLLQSSLTPLARAAGLEPERFSAEANGLTELMAPALYGLGLVAAIPGEAIAARADPEDADGDGISGRIGVTEAGGLGRFGMKAVHGTLESFIEGATRGELGLTTPGLPDEERPAGQPLPPGADPSADPEVDEAFLEGLTDYVRFLAVPMPAIPESREDRASVARGLQLFDAVGCSWCHVPTWTTGDHASEALAHRRFRVYSDFLLHDMGPALGDICAPGSTPSEWRTAPLVGLSHRSVFLHDGRAQNLTAAIQFHGGEADGARERFLGLEESAKGDLLRFLESL
ncbi:MAG: hypothetical protein JSU98_16605 [Gemmatimonadales bacterium]|nr:MAG: hypothetical protein JSU98_16605 [Gemmatimonadales bacterium]